MLVVCATFVWLLVVFVACAFALAVVCVCVYACCRRFSDDAFASSCAVVLRFRVFLVCVPIPQLR